MEQIGFYLKGWIDLFVVDFNQSLTWPNFLEAKDWLTWSTLTPLHPRQVIAAIRPLAKVNIICQPPSVYSVFWVEFIIFLNKKQKQSLLIIFFLKKKHFVKLFYIIRYKISWCNYFLVYIYKLVHILYFKLCYLIYYDNLSNLTKCINWCIYYFI